MEMLPTAVTALVAALGGGSLVGLILKRRWAVQDKKEDVHVTVESKKIDQDQHAFDAVMGRLTAVEGEQKELRTEIKDLNTKVAEEMAKNSRLEAENEALKKDNVRQQGEIERLRVRVHDLADKLQSRDAQILSLNNSLANSAQAIETLRGELHQTTMDLNRMRRKIDGETNTA